MKTDTNSVPPPSTNTHKFELQQHTPYSHRYRRHNVSMCMCINNVVVVVVCSQQRMLHVMHFYIPHFTLPPNSSPQKPNPQRTSAHVHMCIVLMIGRFDIVSIHMYVTIFNMHNVCAAASSKFCLVMEFFFCCMCANYA